MIKHKQIVAVIFGVIFCTSFRVHLKSVEQLFIDSKTKYSDSLGPTAITRNIIQDRKGNIWIASFGGVFLYDGKKFTNITRTVTSARFFSILEDKKGNYWFGTIGSGVYYFDGRTFQNFTTKNGLLNNDVGCIYEDKSGKIWFGVSGGASCFDGISFRNYIIENNEMKEDLSRDKRFIDRQPHEVNAIIEDKKGNYWFATRGNTYVFDRNNFSIFTHFGRPLKNVRSIIEDQKGNIWLGGSDGLWQFNGYSFTNLSRNFVGYVYEDKKGNILTSSSEGVGSDLNWLLLRYNGNARLNTGNQLPEVLKKNKAMIFGILETNDGTIWFGTINGVSQINGLPYSATQ